ncbi:MAG: hypothetical protein LKF87_10745 [Clostridium tyrobutyricum]|jgi:hypothetical protein|uniref:hypothetical protein n=1 Tax=Clostridium tyrobutyricum TaxID=1519 RepID=UPI0018A9ECAD|nr:hypothetical protein [Clostridium tyrobutyricum]MCH4201204.1 hypothetical protein [Clostridium tyrobutyricum]MCH4237762.1 hypothetical protein [Clostridium tyrobutyricum]MCH4259421.1 hypothetical protein [Clostridium tyrobutyricum]MCI1653688.1 hypothetical protein [Clostridium tyrobutyricum]MCI1937830.1 hypothetical protein [Clostridium tyrobutyricum]
MELQVRISVETAEMFEELKSHYQKTMDINFSKSDVLIKAVSNASNIWEQIDWEYVNKEPIKIEKYDISKGSLRPKLQLTFDIEEKLNDLKAILPQKLKLRSVTFGVCIKHILKFALLELQHDKNIKIEYIIEKNKSKYLTDLYSKETQLAIKNFSADILLELDNYELLINKK